MISRGVACYLQMGLGKTKVVIDLAEILFQLSAIKKVLVIMPLSIVSAWEEELQKHSSISMWRSLLGPVQQRLEELATLQHQSNSKLKIAFINVDGIGIIKEQLRQQQFDMVVVDESSMIKNRTAQRTKLIIELFSSAPYKIIMSGNPIPKSPVEIFSQYAFVEPGVFGTNYFQFENRFFLTDYFRKVIGFKNQQEYQKAFHSIAFRKTKKECLDLPAKIFEKEHIPMAAEQERVYRIMWQDAVASYQDGTCVAPVVITKMLRCSQIAGGIFPADDGRRILLQPNPKLQRLLELSEEVPTQGQFVVWAHFTAEIEMIKKALDKEGITCTTFYGATTYAERVAAAEVFKKGQVRAFIAHPATGGFGINFLARCEHVFYYSHNYSAEQYQQSQDRTNRMGSVSSCVYVHLLMKSTIDEMVLRVLEANGDFAQSILDRTLKVE
mgnify:CR=1 FL=1